MKNSNSSSRRRGANQEERKSKIEKRLKSLILRNLAKNWKCFGVQFDI